MRLQQFINKQQIDKIKNAISGIKMIIVEEKFGVNNDSRNIRINWARNNEETNINIWQWSKKGEIDIAEDDIAL